MATFSPEAAVLANTTLMIELIKKLSEKGVLNNQDWQDMLAAALGQLHNHSEGAQAIEFIKNIANLD